MNDAGPIWLRILAVVVFAVPGIWLLGMSVDAIPALGGQFLAPRWIVALAGLIFVLCASYVALDAAPRRFIVARQIVILSIWGRFATLFS